MVVMMLICDDNGDGGFGGGGSGGGSGGSGGGGILAVIFTLLDSLFFFLGVLFSHNFRPDALCLRGEVDSRFGASSPSRSECQRNHMHLHIYCKHLAVTTCKPWLWPISKHVILFDVFSSLTVVRTWIAARDTGTQRKSHGAADYLGHVCCTILDRFWILEQLLPQRGSSLLTSFSISQNVKSYVDSTRLGPNSTHIHADHAAVCQLATVQS